MKIKILSKKTIGWNYLVLLLLIFIFIPKNSFASGGDLIWIQQINHSPAVEKAYAITVDSDAVYIGGSSSGKWTIEKRNLNNGSLIWSQVSSTANSVKGIAVDSNSVYLAGVGNGAWAVEKRNKNDGNLDISFGILGNGMVIFDWAYSEQADSVAVDSTGIYMAGYACSGYWRVMKLSLDGKTTLWDYEVLDSANAHAYALAIDDNYFYAAGFINGSYWKIEKRNKNNGSLVTSFDGDGTLIISSFSGSVYGLAVDSTGLYATGYDNGPGNFQLRTEKRNLNNGISIWAKTINIGSSSDYATGIALDSSGAYVVGYSMGVGGGSYKWHIEKRDLTSGDLIPSFGTGGTIDFNPSNYADYAYGVAVDTTGIYIAGTDRTISSVDEQWRIEKRETGNYIDIGLRYYDGSSVVSIAADPVGILTSSLRIAKNGQVYGIALVDPDDSSASKIKIQTSSGIKALRKY